MDWEDNLKATAIGGVILLSLWLLLVFWPSILIYGTLTVSGIVLCWAFGLVVLGFVRSFD